MKLIATSIIVVAFISCGSISNKKSQSTADSLSNLTESIARDTTLSGTIQNSSDTLVNDLSGREENKVVYLKYKQPVKDYYVMVKWFPYNGNAIMSFRHKNSLYDNWVIFNESYSNESLGAFEDYKNNQLVELDYIAPPNGKILDEMDNAPFSFGDVDFDGKDELLINVSRAGNRGCNRYDIYKIHDNSIEKLTAPPYHDLQNLDVIDHKRKKITTNRSSSAYDSQKFVYGYHPMKYTKEDKEALGEIFDKIYNPIKLDSVYTFTYSRTYVFARKADGLKLISNTVNQSWIDEHGGEQP